MTIKYVENVGIFKALADVNRLMIIDMLSCGELCACKILEKFNITQPTLSHHMKILCECGLVNGRKEGKWVYYSLDENRVQDFKKFFCAITIDQEDCICKGGFSMKTMSIYEPAMCCETGICGVSIDPELLRISTVFNNLKKNSVSASRFNLSSSPQAFIDNAKINALINSKEGIDALPATVIDGEIVKTKVYPTNEEIASWLEIPANCLGEEKAMAKAVVIKTGVANGTV